MEKTTNCRSVSNPHFQTRKATKADVSSIAEMIKVRFVTSLFPCDFFLKMLMHNSFKLIPLDSSRECVLRYLFRFLLMMPHFFLPAVPGVCMFYSPVTFCFIKLQKTVYYPKNLYTRLYGYLHLHFRSKL